MSRLNNTQKRAMVWLLFGSVGIVGWFFGKDLTQLGPFAAMVVAGSVGVSHKD